MKIEKLQEICEKIGYKMEEQTLDDVKFYTIGEFKINPADESKWWVCEVIWDNGDRYTPPCTDLKKIELVNSLDKGVEKVLNMLESRKIAACFQAAYEDQMEDEWEIAHHIGELECREEML